MGIPAMLLRPAAEAWAKDCASVLRPLPLSAKKPFWEKAPPQFDEAGRCIKGGFNAKQLEWWNLDTFIRAYVGGFGAGKTFIGAKRTIGLALENYGCMVAAVSPTFPQARKTIIPTISALLAGKQSLYGGQQFWFRYNKSTHEFFIRYRGRDGLIQVMSADDPDSLRGPNVAAVWLDEPFLMADEVFPQMIARVRHPDARRKEINLTGTPEQIANWGYSLLCGEMGEDMRKAGIGIGLVQASSRDNPATGADYIKRLEGAFTEKAAEAYIEGGFVDLSKGQVFYGFQALGSGRNIQSLPMPPGAELGAGMDFNVNPMAAAIFWHTADHIHFIDEIELPNADTELMCAELRERYCDPNSGKYGGETLDYIYPDASGASRHSDSPGGKTDFHYIQEAGFRIRAPHKNGLIKDKWNAVNGCLRPKAGPPRLTIDPSCKKLARYLQTYTHENAHKKAYKHMSHLCDALSYSIVQLFPVTREAMGEYRLSGL